MDAVQPNLTVNHAVNGGERSGVRAAFRVVPSGRLTFTPRVVYQDVKMDGWNRIDAFNILANPYTTTRDRKSTRLNSSHGYISYAVFCLKKKKETNRIV